MPISKSLVTAVVAVLVASACASGDEGQAMVDATISTSPFAAAQCDDGFVARDLDHTTTPRGDVVAMLDGTGAGVLAEDLDDDGWVDLVLPNLSGETSILWNRGDLRFEREALDRGRFRQAITADADGDGRRDLLLSTGVGPPVLYRGVAGDGPRPVFERTELPDVRTVAFSMAAGDIDGDGGIDLLTGSYNAELTANRDSRALLEVDVGTALHRLETDGGFATEVLATSAQSLVSQIVDVDGDGRADVVAGNDLGTPDRIWLGSPTGLVEATPFDTTTLSTMSIDVGDLDNDGDRDLVATDMKPMNDDPETLQAWEPIMGDIEAARVDDVQTPENVVQIRSDDGFENQAAPFGVDATGWSWSGLLGDLDNDGLQDLYVVNGMRAAGMFDHLPDSELVEPNQAFRNTGDGLAPAPEWGLADRTGGRGMAQADLDRDGDLDIVINNVAAPARLFENRVCGNSAIVVDPVWTGVQNRDALGATVLVRHGDETYLRIVTGSRGYLSTSPSEAHFGLGSSADAVTVEVVWPDGAISSIDGVEPGQHVSVVRS